MYRTHWLPPGRSAWGWRICRHIQALQGPNSAHCPHTWCSCCCESCTPGFMSVPAASAVADQAPDWSALPAGVLRHIMRRASTWQVPGSCLAAPVCRTWASAADGCTDIRLLYQPGSWRRAASFGTWLAHNSPCLDALILMAIQRGDAQAVLEPLAAAAAAAAAEGVPLPLGTLRVLGPDGPSLQLTGQLLAVLPNLITLVTGVKEEVVMLFGFLPAAQPITIPELEHHLAPLKQATQLQDLFLVAPKCISPCGNTLSRLLPTNLRRLAWLSSSYLDDIPDLTHLSRLTFLQLLGWDEGSLARSKLPPGLRQLQLGGASVSEEVLEEVKEVLTGFEFPYLLRRHMRHMSACSQMNLVTVAGQLLRDTGVRSALAQVPSASILRVREDDSEQLTPEVLGAIAPAAASLPNLNHLFLDLHCMPPAAGLAALAALTRLTLVIKDVRGNPQQQQQQQQQARAWAKELRRMPALKWLSVPGELLLVEEPWLAALQQLRVLFLANLLDDKGAPGPSVMERVVTWLEGASPQVLPPRLLLLCLTGIFAGDVTSHRLYPRVRHLLSSGGCEVVGGAGLELAGDPFQQMAGLPEALQQALLA